MWPSPMWTSIKMGGLVEATTSLMASYVNLESFGRKEKKEKEPQINDGRETRAESTDANLRGGGNVWAC